MERTCNSCSRIPREGRATCDYHLEMQKQRAVKRKAAGLCTQGICENPIAGGHTVCRSHLRKMLLYSMARRAKRNAAKICITCGIRPQWWTQYCLICWSNHPNRHKSLLPNGAIKALAKWRRFEAIDARRAAAEQAITRLIDAREIEILTMRHGLADGVDRTLEEIGARLTVTRERIRQIEALALEKLERLGVGISLMRVPFGEIQRAKAETRKNLTSAHYHKLNSAHKAVGVALASGTLVKQPCEKCGNVKVVAHHHDYNQPLAVQWLCRSHHMQAHGRGNGILKPKQRRGSWLNKLTPSRWAKSAWETLAAYHIKQADIMKTTGLNRRQVRDTLTSDNPEMMQLASVQQFAANLVIDFTTAKHDTDTP